MINCKAVVAFFIAVLFFPAIAWTNPNPSFDCAKASSFAEVAICSNDELAELDMRMSMAYKAQLATTSNINSARATQRSWIRMREACDSVTCIRNLYVARIPELGGGVIAAANNADEPASDGYGDPCFDREAEVKKISRAQLNVAYLGFEFCFGYRANLWYQLGNSSGIDPESEQFAINAEIYRDLDQQCYGGNLSDATSGANMLIKLTKSRDGENLDFMNTFCIDMLSGN